MKKLLLSVLAIGFVISSNAMASGNTGTNGRKAAPVAKAQAVRAKVQKTCKYKPTITSPFSREGKLVKAAPTASPAPKAVRTKTTT